MPTLTVELTEEAYQNALTLPLAESVDRFRGKALPEGTPLQPGESLGTDLAESVSVLALRVRTDISGARGKGIE